MCKLNQQGSTLLIDQLTKFIRCGRITIPNLYQINSERKYAINHLNVSYFFILK